MRSRKVNLKRDSRLMTTTAADPRDYTDAEERAVRRLYHIESSLLRPFLTEFLDPQSTPRAIYAALISQTRMEEKNAETRRLLRQRLQKNLPSGRTLGEEPLVKRWGNEKNITLLKHALHSGAGASIALADLSADEPEGAQAFTVDLPWMMPDLDVGYTLRTTQRVVANVGSKIAAQSRESRTYNILLDDDLVAPGADKRPKIEIYEKFDLTAPMRRRIDGTLAPPMQESLEINVDGKLVVALEVKQFIDPATGALQSFTSPDQVRGTAVLFAVKIAAYASIWRVFLAAGGAACAFTFPRNGQDKIFRKLHKDLSRISRDFGETLKISDQQLFHVELRNEVNMLSAANKERLDRAESLLLPINKEFVKRRRQNLFTVIDRIRKRDKVPVSAFKPIQKSIDNWNAELVQISGIVQGDQKVTLEQIAQKLRFQMQQATNINLTLDAIGTILKAVRHVHQYAPLTLNVPDEVQNLYADLRSMLDSSLAILSLEAANQLSDLLRGCAVTVPGVTAFSDALRRAGLVETDKDALTSAMVFLISQALLDRPGNREINDDTSVVVSIARGAWSCLSLYGEDNAAFQQTQEIATTWTQLFTPATEFSGGNPFASAVRGPTDPASFGARVIALIGEANALLKREVLRQTGAIKSYTARLRNLVWQMAKYSTDNNYENVEAVNVLDKAKNSARTLVFDIGASLFAWPSGVQLPEEVPLSPDTLTRGEAQIVDGILDSNIINLEQGTLPGLGVGDAGIQPSTSQAVFAALLIYMRAAKAVTEAMLVYYGSNGETVTDLSKSSAIEAVSTVSLIERTRALDIELNEERKNDFDRVIDEAKDEFVTVGLNPPPPDSPWASFTDQADRLAGSVRALPVGFGDKLFAQEAGHALELLRRRLQDLCVRYAKDENIDDDPLMWLAALASLRAAARLNALEIELSDQDPALVRGPVVETARFLARQLAVQLLAWLDRGGVTNDAFLKKIVTDSDTYRGLWRTVSETQGGQYGQVAIPTVVEMREFFAIPDQQFKEKVINTMRLYYDAQRSMFRKLLEIEWNVGSEIVIGDISFTEPERAAVVVGLVSALEPLNEIAANVERSGDATSRHNLRLEAAFGAAEPLNTAVAELNAQNFEARTIVGHIQNSLRAVSNYMYLISQEIPLDRRLFDNQDDYMHARMLLCERRLVTTLARYGGIDVKPPEREELEFTPESLADVGADRILLALQ